MEGNRRGTEGGKGKGGLEGITLMCGVRISMFRCVSV